ncbi:hypothetical protein ACFOOP_01910 [Marinicaulis aureus]|uniref:Uncharacterized protein n=1 Tax=Hyphococcus aureus TaxID=2666033 RepID=A0ABW1KTQ3_9PROT
MARHLSDHHLTPQQVEEMASRAGVEKVVVTHFVTGSTGAAGADPYAAAIKSVFDGPVAIANDLNHF